MGHKTALFPQENDVQLQREMLLFFPIPIMMTVKVL